MKYTEVRYLPKKIISPVWIEIHKETVLIGHIKEFDAIVFLITDKEIVKGYLDYFNLIWTASKR
jgi:small nuclear ribonucleoprotein (snRNP)-like protein